jgi:hypothetical protein
MDLENRQLTRVKRLADQYLDDSAETTSRQLFHRVHVVVRGIPLTDFQNLPLVDIE